MSTAERAKLVGPSNRWEVLQAFQIDFLKANGLQPEHTLVDIGCGVLRGGIPLIDYLNEGNYYGLESRDHVLNEGRKELEEADLVHKNPTLIVSRDFDKLNLPAPTDFMWAYSVLFHMTDEILDSCLRFVSRNLKEDGVFYTNVHTGEKNFGTWKRQEMPKVRRPITEYQQRCKKAGLNQFLNIGTVKDWGLTGVKEVSAKPLLRITK